MKDVSDFTEQFDRCLMNEPPFCAAACPFRFDVRLFVQKIKQNHLSTAYKKYRDAVVFPGIVSRLCDRPCETVCPLGPVDRPIDLIGIERCITDNARPESPDAYNLKERDKSVCVIGGGLSGLACALKLAQKKYTVTIFGPPQSLPEEFEEEIRYQLQNEVLNTKECYVKTQAEIMAMGFDAVYVATGEGGDDYGLSAPSNEALPNMIIPHNNAAEASGHPGRGGLNDLAAEAGVCWIAGGALVGRKGVYAIADGAIAAAAIDAFLRTGVLRTDRPGRTTRMVLDPQHLKHYKTKLFIEQRGATEEASRCLGCRCDACKIYCDLPPYVDKWPPRICDEVFVTTLPGKAEVKATPAKRLINTDNLSGVLANVCPAGIDMDALLLAGRRSMHRQGKMPWSFHEFWLRDMEHANSESAAILMKPHLEKDVAFFPGCQLGASSPSLVRAVYEELQLPGLIVRCCGAPAEWAGDEELFAETLTELRAEWEALGKPVLACACPTCMRMLGKHAPEIKTVSLYEILPEKPDTRNETWAVFDPCSAKDMKAMRSSVREHAKSMGIVTELLPVQEEVQRCCGYGGQPEIADPAFIGYVRENRASESDLPYICYCMNCREAFLKAGKPSSHILELRYADIEATPELSPSKRRKNRESLKASLLPGAFGPSGREPNIAFADGVREKMDADRILSEDVFAVIGHIQSTKESVYHPASGVRSGSLVIGKTTYWVGFKEEGGSLTVTNTYAHRLAVVHEEVWAGTTKEQRRQAAQEKTEVQRNDGDLICERCGVEMKEMDVEFSYLGRSFRHEVKRCPACGLAYIPEELARGRMRDVEMSLEDK